MADEPYRKFVFQMENPNTRTLFDIEVAIKQPLYSKQTRTLMETRIDGHKFGELHIEMSHMDGWVDGLLALGAEEVKTGTVVPELEDTGDA